MKLYIKRVIFIILIIALVLCAFFITDLILVNNNKKPIFCKQIKEYWDGGSYECYGIGYKVNVYKDIKGQILKEEIGTYNLEFNK